MEILIWIVFGIIYAIAQASGRNPSTRVSGYGRYGLWGMQEDFSLEFDPLEDIRQKYDERLKIYYMHNQPKTYLINQNCEARLIKEDNGDFWFYVKDRTTGKFSGAYFEVKGNSAHASTMWAIIDMEFNSLTRFFNIRDLYYRLNQGFETRGGLKYLYQPITGGLPKLIFNKTNKMAQNEFCRMEIKILPDGENVIVCSEIWSDSNYDKPRKFVIKGEKLILYGILSEFAKNKNKMLKYLDLLYAYMKRTDCTVEEIADDIKTQENPKPASEFLKEPEFKKEPEPIKYIHVDLDEKPKEPEVKQNEENNISEKEIKKYDERNLDL